MQTLATFPIPAAKPETLSRCHLITDSNAHRPDLLLPTPPAGHHALISEAMLPQVRLLAMLIAASRHDFSQPSPSVFAEEADWFAARILALQARIFHLDVSLKPMLDLANRRAEAFARRHHLPFTAATSRMSLHAGRPANLLIIETALLIDGQDEGIVANSRRLAAQLGEILPSKA